MKLRQEEMDGGVLRAALSGSFDIAGASDVDLPLSVIGGSQDKVIVDLAEVDFLASIGVRILVKAAKSMANRGGRMVILNAGEAPRRVLETTGVDSIIPLVDSEEEARAALAA